MNDSESKFFNGHLTGVWRRNTTALWLWLPGCYSYVGLLASRDSRCEGPLVFRPSIVPRPADEAKRYAGFTSYVLRSS